MGTGRNWKPEEKEYLSEHWGKQTIPTLCKNLNRPEGGIINMAKRLHLGSFYESGEYITMHQLIIALGYASSGCGYKNKSWIENRDFPVKHKKHTEKVVKIVYLKDFWKWAEKNQSFLDFSNFEENILGKEPLWAKEKRKRDRLHLSENIKTPWTPKEDAYLKDLLRAYRFTYPEISKRLKRTEGAIQRRICDLKIKERPLKADNHNLWTDEQITLLGNLIKQGFNYEAIHRAIPDKSVKAIRGLVYRYYITESLDKARLYIGDGTFGENIPARQLRHFRVMTPEERNEMKEYASQLAYLINQRARQISPVKEIYKDFWQKDMCMNWSDIHGCQAGEENCDSCCSFVRVREQYCVRCGSTIFAKQEIKICDKCRIARKKQAQKKWAVMNKRNNKEI